MSLPAGSSGNANDIAAIPFDELRPDWWKNDEYNRIVLDKFVSVDGKDTRISIQAVKDSIIAKVVIDRAELGKPTNPGDKVPDPIDRAFDAHLFHAIIKEKAVSQQESVAAGEFCFFPIYSPYMVLSRFEPDSMNVHHNFICADGVAERDRTGGEGREHYVLKFKNSSEGKYRCITCGERDHLVTLGDMTEGFKKKWVGVGKAETKRLGIIASLSALPNRDDGKWKWKATKNAMVEAGIKLVDQGIQESNVGRAF